MEFGKSLNSSNLLKFRKGFLSILEYFNVRITKYGSRKVKVGCCENHSNLYTADEDEALKSIVLFTLDNNSTLLSILDNFHITMRYLEGTSTEGFHVCTYKNWSCRRHLRIVRLINQWIFGRACGSFCSRASGFLKILIMHTWDSFISGFRTFDSAEGQGHPRLVFRISWLVILQTLRAIVATQLGHKVYIEEPWNTGFLDGMIGYSFLFA